jgi:hypothetical protein
MKKLAKEVMYTGAITTAMIMCPPAFKTYALIGLTVVAFVKNRNAKPHLKYEVVRKGSRQWKRLVEHNTAEVR